MNEEERPFSSQQETANFKLDMQNWKKVQKSWYLESVLTEDNICEIEIRRYIGIAKYAF